jgi:transcriptional antiterminator NusG
MNESPRNTSDENAPDQTADGAESPSPELEPDTTEERVEQAIDEAAAVEEVADSVIDEALVETVAEAVVEAAAIEAASDEQIQEAFEETVESAVESGLEGEALAEAIVEAAAEADAVEAVADAVIEEALEETVVDAVAEAEVVEAVSDAAIVEALAEDLERIEESAPEAVAPEPEAEAAPEAKTEPEPEPEAKAEAEPEAEPEEPAAHDPFRGPGDWYVVHTYAGYENKVKTNLESRIHTMQMEEKIFDVHIPMEDVMEIKGGKKQVVQRKVFPGYLLVKMIYDNDSWYVVRNTPGVTGFVAAGTGSKPTPLSKREVEKILAVKKEVVKPQFRLGFEEGDVVRIISGPFADFNGTISEINLDQSKLKVLVNIFDRETPVELSFDQVAKV